MIALTLLLTIILRATGIMGAAFWGWLYNLLILVQALLVMGLGCLGDQMVFPAKA